MFVITCDCNATSSSWWPNGIDTTKRTKLFARDSSDGFQQLINGLTHIQKIALLVLILFSQISQTCPSIMELILLYIQNVTIKVFISIFILPNYTPPPPPLPPP